jgi:hypothetical protein
MNILNLGKGSRSIIGLVGAVATFIVLVCNQLGDGFQVSDLQSLLAGFSALMLAIGWTGKLVGMEKK